jgi:hypothetical protein
VTHLELLNVVLALRYRHPGWPTLLADCGYLVHGVGVTIAARVTISPDVLASSAERNTVLLFEVKGGSDLDMGQFRRMQQIGATDLRDFAHLPICDTSACKVGIVYFCNSEEFAAVCAAVGGRAGVVGFDGGRFAVEGDGFPDQDLVKRLRSAAVEPGTLPPGIVPFDQHSRLGDVARVVIPELVAAMVSGSGVVTSDDILRKTHQTCHDVMRSTGSGAELSQIQRRVVDVLREAASGDFRDWLQKVPDQNMWRFVRAVSTDQAAKTRDFSALRKAANALIERLGVESGIQLSLEFDEQPQK